MGKRVKVAGTAAGAALLLSVLLTPAQAETELVGELQLIHADSETDSIEVPFLSVNGKLYRLEGADTDRYESEQRVRVTGRSEGRTIDVQRIRSAGAAPADPPPAPTSVHALIQLVTWTTPDGTTQADAEKQYADTNAAWFDRESYGALDLTADATNWLRIAPPADDDGPGLNTPCDNIGAIQTTADQAAAQAGFRVADYSHVVYYYPSCPQEQWGGWGQQPGNRTWLIGEMSTRVGVHELGHNLGLGHSNTDFCTLEGVPVPYSATCTAEEYGDPVSAMGAGFQGQGMYSAGQQVRLGWLGSGTHKVRTITYDGSYALTPLESRTGGTQALRVTDRAGQPFEIEYRQPTFNDTFLWPGVTGGVLIRSGSETSDLYDMTPATAGQFSDAALPVGSSWSSPAGGLKVTVTSRSKSSASVKVVTGRTELPGRPVVGKASAGTTSDHSVSVTGRWSKPTSGGAVTSYYVTATRASTGSTKTVVVSGSVRSAKVTGLRKKATYQITVTAKNAAGKGSRSKASHLVTAR